MSTRVVPLVEFRDVSKTFTKNLDLAGKMAQRMGADLRDETVHAVDGVNLAVLPGRVVGLVGESGCGKSTLGRIAAGILPPSGGAVFFDGADVSTLNKDRKATATLAVQMIFQDPYSSLNPRMTVEEIVGEGPVINGLIRRRERSKYVDTLLDKVGLAPEFKKRYPHQFSGGQRQRIGIARALSVNPLFLVCDEAISALDVSIQAQIINLFIDLQEEFNLTYLFISHDLTVVEHISDHVAIMYLGRIVEIAKTRDIFENTKHPYTHALISEVPRLEGHQKDYQPIVGEIPSPLDPPTGCHFHPRCPNAMERCSVERPKLLQHHEDHFSACFLYE